MVSTASLLRELADATDSFTTAASAFLEPEPRLVLLDDLDTYGTIGPGDITGHRSRGTVSGLSRRRPEILSPERVASRTFGVRGSLAVHPLAAMDEAGGLSGTASDPDFCFPRCNANLS